MDINNILENLENLEEKLLEYENSLDKEEDNTNLVHIIFRYAHNLKSSLAMAHKEKSSHLIHIIENNFDLIRNGIAKGDKQLTSLTFASIDIIKESLNSDNEDEENIAQLLEILEEIYKDKSKTKKLATTINFSLNENEKKLLDNAIEKKIPIYQVEKLIKTNLTEEEYNNLPILGDINEIGFLIARYPAYNNLNKEVSEEVLKIVFATDLQEKDLELYIFDPFRLVDTSNVKTKNLQESEAKHVKNRSKDKLKILIVEDDFISRRYMMAILSKYGDCDIAVDGKEAVEAFNLALESGDPYDVIFLDIMMPGFDGQQALSEIREKEKLHNIEGLDRVKIIMTTALSDADNILKSFREQADAYLIKPISKISIVNQLHKLKLLEENL